ncbi:MAG TPA: hypothetical protein VFS66_07015 [Acidimicrobiia bacterium]|nr:hypothetical protein [Acidimicrobiia bacterium]
MRQKMARLLGGDCQHERTRVTDSVGVRRVVCEGCGRISFDMAELLKPRTRQEPKRQELSKAAGL